MSFRYFFAWVGGLTVQVMLFAVFLQPSEGDPQGFFHLPGWNLYGLVGASSIFTAILVTALGTHHRIPHLKSAPPERGLTIGKIFSEIWETLSNPSFRALFVATLFGLLATGISATLNQYINGFFWNFTGDQIAMLTFAVYISAIMALVMAPIAGRRWGKKRAAIIIGLMAFTLAPAPVFARLLGLLPANGTPELFYIILVVTVFDVALIIAYQMLAASMVTDIVEESELKTGRRSEGTFFAGITFIRKLSQGVGVVTASLILAVAAIAPGTRPEDASPESVASLGFGYAATLLTVWMLMILAISFYRISREDHARNLAALADKAAE
ncbi:MAG: MFS transporter, partial [Pseudomonadota bacterium]|nr:MFS transporter [Pseudomonadota bacterium]